MWTKQPEHDERIKERARYPHYFEMGLIAALLVVVGLFKMDLPAGEIVVFDQESDGTIITLTPPPTEFRKQPPPPPKPVIPVVAKGDGPVDEEIEFGPTDNLTAPLGAPSQPPGNAEPNPDVEEPFILLERNPEIVGGMRALVAHLTYPELARRNGIEGRVILEFDVDERGRVLNARVKRGIGFGCDEAALAALSQVRFTPGMQRGRPVKVKFSLPVTFKLSS